jgi:hypothetical protein
VNLSGEIMNNIPNVNCSINEIFHFALSFNGYQFVNGGPEKLVELWDRVAVDWENASLDELRACLFYLQRAIRWTNNIWSDSDIEQARDLIYMMHIVNMESNVKT